MSQYQDLKDPQVIGGSAGPNSFANGRVFTKFCTMGVVTSRKWNDTYITIQDGFVRLYDADETYRTNPANYVLEIFIGSRHETSEPKAKDYSKNAYTPAVIHYVYLQINNGMWAPHRLLKIGTTDLATLNNIKKCIKTVASA